MIDPEETTKKSHEFAIGQVLDPLSVHELEQVIARLETEIERLRAEIARKSAQRNAADALFKS